jgi:hypothetical protein
VNVVEKLYEFGLSISSFLLIISETVVEIGEDEIERNSVPGHQRDIAVEFKILMRENIAHPDSYIDFINKYKNILLGILYSWGCNGGFIAIGYVSINNPNPVIIPKHEWAYLRINTEENMVYCEERNYNGVKYILPKQLEYFSVTEQEELNLMLNLKLESERNTQPDIQLNNKKKNESKARTKKEDSTKAVIHEYNASVTDKTEEVIITPTFLTVKQFAKKYPAFPEGGLRHMIFHEKANGLKKSGAIIRNGRRILIKEERFFVWVESQN